MRNISITKTEKGYVLGFGPTVKALSMAVSATLLVPVVFLIILNLIFTDIPTSAIELTVALILSVGFMVLMYCLSFGHRLVIDETGVHRYFFRRLKMSLIWRHIRSCGIDTILVPNRGGQSLHLAFYASTEADPVTPKNKLVMSLTPQDEAALREAGLVSFCRTHMAEQIDRNFP